jgi:transposase
VLSTGCQWRYAPKDFPSKSTLHRYFDLWEGSVPGGGGISEPFAGVSGVAIGSVG